jgi:predicted transcriptional regulator
MIKAEALAGVAAARKTWQDSQRLEADARAALVQAVRQAREHATLEEIAGELDVTRQAVYKLLRDSG